MRRCTKCRKRQPDANFAWHETGVLRMARCRRCKSIAARRYYKRNPLHIQEGLSYGVRLDLNAETRAVTESLRDPVKVRFYLRGYWRRPVV